MDVDEVREKLLNGEETFKTTWSDTLHETYTWSLLNASDLIDKGEIDIFKASTALAICYGLWKEETMHDLMELRGE